MADSWLRTASTALTRKDQRRARLDEKCNEHMTVVVGHDAIRRIGHRSSVIAGSQVVSRPARNVGERAERFADATFS